MTGTAALAFCLPGVLPTQRRILRHLPAARISPRQRSMQRKAASLHYLFYAARENRVRRKGMALAVSNRVQGIAALAAEVHSPRLDNEFPHPQPLIKEHVMHTTTPFPHRSFTAIIPVILRITLSLFLWTLGASAMDLRIPQTEPKEHRTVVNFPVDRARIQNLERWVNAGHDTWCRDPQLVAGAALRRICPDLPGYESASLPLQLETSRKNRTVYVFHSLDGLSTYRITLRRHRFLLPAAGTNRQIFWIPESAEIVTRDSRD
jgi:hypothetical protein